jgi:hypothetical protein
MLSDVQWFYLSDNHSNSGVWLHVFLFIFSPLQSSSRLSLNSCFERGSWVNLKAVKRLVEIEALDIYCSSKVNTGERTSVLE